MQKKGNKPDASCHRAVWKRAFLLLTAAMVLLMIILPVFPTPTAKAAVQTYDHFEKHGYFGNNVTISVLHRKNKTMNLLKVHTPQGVKRVFCCLPYGHAHTQNVGYGANTNGDIDIQGVKPDTYTMTEVNAKDWTRPTWTSTQMKKPKEIVKGLIWLKDKTGNAYSKNQHSSDDLWANFLVQIWTWSNSIGVNPETAVNQFLANKSVSNAIPGGNAGKTKFKAWLKQIQQIDRIYGKVQIFRIYKCYWHGASSNLAEHQIYVRWRAADIPKNPKSYNVSDLKKKDQEFKLSIFKKGSISGAPVGGVKYKISGTSSSAYTVVNGYSSLVNKTYETEGNGKVVISGTRSYTTNRITSATFKYYSNSNWGKLSDKQQAEAIKSGIYSETQAKAKARADLDSKLEAEMNRILTTQFFWTITEQVTNNGKVVTNNRSKTVSEGTNARVTFLNDEKYGYIEVSKVPASKKYEEVDNPMTGAVIEVIADETLLRIDGEGTIPKGTVVETITIGNNGKGKTGRIPAGRYILKEKSAPSNGKFAVSSQSPAITLAGGNVADLGTNTEGRIEDPPVVKDLYFRKVMETIDGPANEQGSRFKLTGNRKLADGTTFSQTAVSGSDGMVTFTDVPYGTYTLTQETSSEDTKKIGPFTNIIVNEKSSENLAETAGIGEKIEGEYVLFNPSKKRISIHKRMTDSSYSNYNEETGKWIPVIDKPEKNARFAIYPENVYNENRDDHDKLASYSFASANAAEIMVTDSNGNATSRMLDMAIYWVVQISSADDSYEPAQDFSVDIADGTDHYYDLDDTGIPDTLEIIKMFLPKDEKGRTMDGYENPEYKAEFYVYDKTTVTGLDEYTEKCESDSLTEEYIEEFIRENNASKLGKMTTDKNGYAFMRFPAGFNKENGFVVVQTKGDDDYEIHSPVYSDDTSIVKSRARGRANNYRMDLINAQKYYYAVARIIKKKQENETEYVPEENAAFKAKDDNGEDFSYEVKDSSGTVTGTVDTFVTNEEGVAYIPYLTLGSYMIRQTAGSPKHKMLSDDAWDNVILITESCKQFTSRQLDRFIRSGYDLSMITEDQRQAIAASEFTFKNDLKPVLLKVKKESSTTMIPIDGAGFTLTKKSLDEGQSDNVIEPSPLTTGQQDDEMGIHFENGYIWVDLSPGTYEIKETGIPEGYATFEHYKALSPGKTDGGQKGKGRTLTVTIDADHAKENSDGTLYYYVDLTKEQMDALYEDKSLVLRETPIMGRITMDKTGGITTGFENGEFDIDVNHIGGAIYGLYAGEDLKNDKGDTMYAKDALVSVVKTTFDGDVVFVREVKEIEGEVPSVKGEFTTWDDLSKTTGRKLAKITDRFYLGDYYIRELAAPEGYNRNSIRHFTLTDDTGDTELNDLLQLKDDDNEDADTLIHGRYYLTSGTNFNQAVNQLAPERSAKAIYFTHLTPPASKTFSNGGLIDVSVDKDKSIALYEDAEEEGVLYVVPYDNVSGTAVNDQVIYFNEDCDYMFANLMKIEEILLDNVNTDAMATTVSMFETKSAYLTELDLMNMTTPNLLASDEMFANNPVLTTIYMGEETQEAVEFQDLPVAILAKASTRFLYANDLSDEDSWFDAVNDFDYSFQYSTYNESVDFTYESGGEKKSLITGISPKGPHFDDPGTKEGQLEVTLTYDQTKLRYMTGLEEIVDNFNNATHGNWTLDSFAQAFNDIMQGEIRTTVEVINPPPSKLLAKIVDQDPQQDIISEEDGQTISISLFKGSITALENEPEEGENADPILAGAEFTVTAATDLYNQKTQEIIPSGTVVSVLTTMDASNAGSELPAFEAPCDITARDKNAKYLYRIQETKAPKGFDCSTGILYIPNFSFSAGMSTQELQDLANSALINPDLYKEEFEGKLGIKVSISKDTVKDPDDDTREKEQINQYSFCCLYYDEPVPTISKTWLDVAKLDRPENLTIEARLAGTSASSAPVKTFILNEANNWTAVWRDIPAGRTLEDYEFSEMIPDGYTWTMFGTPRYSSTDMADSDRINYVEIINQDSPRYVAPKVTKIWDDGNDADGIRPSAIHVRLLKNGQPVPGLDDIELNSSNSWSFELKYDVDDGVTDLSLIRDVYDLRKTDDNGEDYIYEWEEIGSDQMTGNAMTGYASTSETTERKVTYEESRQYDVVKAVETTITNEHRAVTTAKVSKHWDDRANGYRPESVEVALYRKVGGSYERLTSYTLAYTDPSTGKETAKKVSPGERVYLSEDNNWEVKAIGLDKFNVSGSRIQYCWKEESVPPGYTKTEGTLTGSEHKVTVSFIDRSGERDYTIASSEIRADLGDSLEHVIRKAVSAVGGSVGFAETKNHGYAYIKDMVLEGEPYNVLSSPFDITYDHPDEYTNSLESQGWQWSFDSIPKGTEAVQHPVNTQKIGTNTRLYMYYYGNAGRTGRLTVNLIDGKTGRDIAVIEDVNVRYNDTLKECIDASLKKVSGKASWIGIKNSGTHPRGWDYLNSITVKGNKYPSSAVVSSSVDAQYYHVADKTDGSRAGWSWNFSGDETDLPETAMSDQRIQNRRELYLYYWDSETEE